jgi:ABC-type transport system involved in cytochrome c biogenesis permease subunit
MTASLGLGLVVLAALLQAVFLMRRENRRDPVSHWILLAAAALLLASLVERSIRIQFAAVTNMYESMVFFAAVTALVLFSMRMARRTRDISPFVTFGATVICLTLIAVSSSGLVPRGIQPPIPALQSYWLVMHVTLSFIGEAFFVVSFVASIAFLAARNPDRRNDMDRLTAAAIGIGYPVFTAGALIFGAIWAETAWGTWWSWDPKETWALITWLIYTAYLHTRLVKKLRGRTSAILAVVGFLATIFTFVGVNFLLSGLHSYG